MTHNNLITGVKVKSQRRTKEQGLSNVKLSPSASLDASFLYVN